MADLRITQASGEVLREGLPELRITQASVEVLRAPVKARLTHVGVEVLRYGVPKARITHVGVEVLRINEVGTVCWGHDTGVVEENTKDYTGNWTGTGAISGAGDPELIGLQTGEYMESQDWYLGPCIFNSARLRQNVYDPTGDDVTLKYKTAATLAALPGTGWSAYTGPFQSLGWVKIRIER